ncbi:MAG: HAD-IA family hydrolase [Actinomycetota bacterium]
MIRAVLWDFGGVITTSPFESFARYEREHGLPEGFIRGLNAADHHENAWAKFERSQVSIDEFCVLYEAEAEAAGHPLDARAVIGCLSGDIRPEMANALHTIKRGGLKQACLTNNFFRFDDAPTREGRTTLLDVFDVIVESSRIGVRKPEPEFYRIACVSLEIEPAEAVMLDDLGVNLKPARELGMTTIKVVDPDDALRELEEVIGFAVR